MKKHKRIVLLMSWEQEISWEISRGIRDYALTQNLEWEYDFNARSFFPEVLTWDLDGIIVLGFHNPADIPLVNQPGCPPLVELSPDPGFKGIPQVDGDPYAAGVLAAEHFSSLGFRRGAWLSFKVPAMQERARGFKEKMEELGGSAQALIELDSVTDIGRPKTIAQIVQTLKKLEKPAAIYCASDHLGRSLIQICRDEQIHIPEEVAVLATENSRFLCESVHPYLSSIDVGSREIGRQAAKVLHRLMDGKPVPERTLLPPLGVTRRQSTDVLAVEDARLRKAIIFLRAHYTEKVDLNALSRSVGLSRRGLEYLFRDVLQRSPHEEIMRLRFDRTKFLLRTTPMTIDEIAEATGFNSGHYLCDMFKRHIQEAPSAYRKKHRTS